MENTNKNQENRPQNKFLNEMYEDLLYLIYEDSADEQLAKRKLNDLREDRNIIDTLDNMQSREEYLKRANERHASKRKPATSYFDDDEPVSNHKKVKKEIKNKTTTTQPISVLKKNIENKEEVQKLSKKEIAVQKTLKLKEFFKRVENAELEDESKLVLKKMISYAKKYSDGIVKNYIPFNMRIYADNDETLYDIVKIIIDSFVFFGYMKNEEYIERSFYIVEDANHITELYNNSNSLVIFRDVQGLLNKDKITRDKLLNILETDIYGYSNLDGITTIVSDKNKKVIDELFENNTILRDKIFDFELITSSANAQEIYHKVLKTFQKNYKVTEEFGVKLLDYITETFPKSQLPANEYAQALIDQILFNQTTSVIRAKSIPKYEKNKEIDEIFEEINELVGLDNVKEMLNDLVSLMKFKSKTEDSLKIKDTNLHMVFLGNPGTGKTTVARMVAGILYNLKYISKNKLVEVSAKDLIGEYVGQTAPKTNAVIEKALGGVLFIDEAYALASKGGGNSFNEECIATLIQGMENYRDDLVVIFAGYSKEMDAFLKSNSGIVSRIGYTMDFKDYTLDELILILKSMFKKAGFNVDVNAIIKAKKIIEEHRKTEGFGNARFVRNLYEKAIIKHATNTVNSNSKKVLKTIVAADITDDNLIKL